MTRVSVVTRAHADVTRTEVAILPRATRHSPTPLPFIYR